MSKKNKHTANAKLQRRLMEAKRAESLIRPGTIKGPAEANSALPVVKIKRDLVGNMLFMLLALGLLFVLKLTNFNYSSLLGALQRL